MIPPDTSNRYIVQPVFKALKVLELVARKGHQISLTAVAKELSLPKTTAFRYLQTLSAAGFITYEKHTDRYSIGTRFRTLAATDTSVQLLREVSLPYLRQLHETFNETVNLGIPSEHRIVYIDMIESTRALRMQARIGSRDPLHSTALGKAILACLPESERLQLLTDSLAERTYRTVTDMKALMKQLDTIARQGFAVEDGENEEGATCIGVSILDHNSRPFAAISLSAPERRLTAEIRELAITQLKEAAGQITQRLPYSFWHYG